MDDDEKIASAKLAIAILAASIIRVRGKADPADIEAAYEDAAGVLFPPGSLPGQGRKTSP